MDSFFFNITENGYQQTDIFKLNKQHITRVDISNGLVFFNISVTSANQKTIAINHLDRMSLMVSVHQGECEIEDLHSQKTITLLENNTYLFTSSRQNMQFNLVKSKQTKLFILFIADFFIKRYLTQSLNEPTNFLYHHMRGNNSLNLLHQTQTDALSLHLINQLVSAKSHDIMHSLVSEHRAIEYMIHRLSLIELHAKKDLNQREKLIAETAKSIILQRFANPPTIKQLASLCATNDNKLKKSFKNVYCTTIYAYVQKVRLERANVMLSESTQSVSEVAHAVGYKHTGHFSAIFFNAFGVYPKDLKSSHL